MTTIGIMSPGDMGNAIGWTLASNGARVLVALDERSARTRALADTASLEDIGSIERLVQDCDIVMSVLVPSEAEAAAERVAAALRSTGSSIAYVDCNAISPATTVRVGAIISDAGSDYVDASIIGGPPRKPGTTRFYASGPHLDRIAALSAHGLDVRPMGDTVGHASAIKMCYAGLTKGLTALGTELLVAANRLGVQDSLRAELESSQPLLVDWLSRSAVGMPSKAHRWIGEMEEIAATFEAVGLTPKPHLGAAEMYAFVASTPLGSETPESIDRTRDLWGTAKQLSQHSTND